MPKITTNPPQGEIQPEARTSVMGRSSDLALRGGMVVLNVGPVLILVLLMAVITILSPDFLSLVNVGNVLVQTAVVAVLALGQLLVILTRGIDLSVGSVLGLATVLGALTFRHVHSDALVLLVMLGTGAGIGLFNGLIIVKGRLPHPFIGTLAMLSIASGLAPLISNGQPILGMPAVVQAIGQGYVAQIPVAAFLVAGLALLTVVLTTVLVWGRWIYAVGGDPEAARRAGIPVGRVLISVYVLSGLGAGFAAVITAGRTNAGFPTAGTLGELDAIAAVIIGGASFLGGRGNVAQALIGAFVIGVLRNGLNLLNVNAFYQAIAIGVVILVAVESDVFRRELERRVRTIQAQRLT